MLQDRLKASNAEQPASPTGVKLGANPLVKAEADELRSLLAKPQKLRSYDEVLELTRRVKDMDFITSQLQGSSVEYVQGNTVGGLGSILRCLDQVCSGMTIQTVEAKQLLYRDGDMAEKVFVVFSGAVELSAPEPKPSTGTAGSPGGPRRSVLRRGR